MAEQKNDAKGSDQVGGRSSSGHCSTCRLKKKEKRGGILCLECERQKCGGKSNSDTEQFDMLGLDKCNVHTKQFEFMCGTHKSLCCSSCFFELHRSCKDVIDLQTYAISKKSRVTMDKVSSMITDIQVCACSITTAIKESQSHMTRQVDSIQVLLDDMKKTILKKIDDFNAKTMKELTEVKDKAVSELDKRLLETKDILHEVDSIRNLVLSLSEIGTEVQKITAFHAVPKKIASLWPLLTNQQDNLSKSQFYLEYKDAIIDILKPDETIGTLRIATQNIHTSPPLEKNLELKILSSAVVKQSPKLTKDPNCSGMDFMPDGRLVVVDNPNELLALMDERLKTLGTHKLTSHRYDVTSLSDNEVAVTGSHSIELFKIAKNHIMTLTKTLSTQSQYFSISLMNETTFLVSTFQDQRPLRMVTLAGEEKDFDLLPNKLYSFNKSRSTFIRLANKCVLTDTDENCVHLYERFGDLVIESVVKNEQIQKPVGVCAGPAGTVFVCSSRTHSIVQLTSSGRKVCFFKLPIKHQLSICVSQDMTRMAISSSCDGESKIQIYQFVKTVNQ